MRVAHLAALFLLCGCVTTGCGDSGQPDLTPEGGRVSDRPVGIGESQRLDTVRTTVEMTVLRVVDEPPVGRFDKPPPRTRFVGVDLATENVGSEPFGGSYLIAGSLVDSDDYVAQTATVGEGPCGTTSDVTIGPGDKRNLCLLFSVDRAAEPRLFQFTVDAGGGGTATAEWNLSR